jgi:hypothetical protein
MKRIRTACLKGRSNSAEHGCQRQVASLVLLFVQVPAKWISDHAPLLLASHQEEVHWDPCSVHDSEIFCRRKK